MIIQAQQKSLRINGYDSRKLKNEIAQVEETTGGATKIQDDTQKDEQFMLELWQEGSLLQKMFAGSSWRLVNLLTKEKLSSQPQTARIPQILGLSTGRPRMNFEYLPWTQIRPVQRVLQLWVQVQEHASKVLAFCNEGAKVAIISHKLYIQMEVKPKLYPAFENARSL